MKRTWSTLLSAAVLAVAPAAAQAWTPYVAFYHPVNAYYAPAPVIYTAAAPVIVEQPVATTAYYPAPAPQPTVAYYPQPAVAYYPPPVPVYQPTARVVTRYRPFLGGTVSRVRYGYAPVTYYP